MKSERDLIGKRYAQALIDLAMENKVVPALVDSIASDLKTINSTITDSPDLKFILNHPSYSIAQKKSLLQVIFMAKVQELTLHLLDLLVNRLRLDLLPAIEAQYRILLNEKRNIVTAQIISSEKLSDNNMADIKARLNEYLGKSLNLETAVDPSLIAGFVLRIGDQVIDGSLKGRLNSIERVLISV